MSDRKANNRAAFPFAAAIVDQLRAVFGPEVKVSYASENGREVGRRLDESRFHVVTGAALMTQTQKDAQ